nr:MAG TPA: hypothetical protein [Caudoviricetes sp.]
MSRFTSVILHVVAILRARHLHRFVSFHFLIYPSAFVIILYQSGS